MDNVILIMDLISKPILPTTPTRTRRYDLRYCIVLCTSIFQP